MLICSKCQRPIEMTGPDEYGEFLLHMKQAWHMECAPPELLKTAYKLNFTSQSEIKMKTKKTFVGEILYQCQPFIFLLLFTSFIVGFLTFIYHQDKAPLIKVKEERINNIVRVLVHDPGEYSALVQEDKTLKSVHLHKLQKFKWGEVELVMDATPGEPCFAVVQYFNKNDSPHVTKVTVHLHSVEDVTGGGWRHGGKHVTTGQTNVVE